MQTKNIIKKFNNNATKLLKLFNLVSHEGQYEQGFEAAANDGLFKTALLFINNLEDLTFEDIDLETFKSKCLNLIDDYFDYYPDEIDFDNLVDFANDRLNYHFNNQKTQINPDISDNCFDKFKWIPNSDNITNLIIEFKNNLKVFCLGLWTIEGFKDYILDFCDEFGEYYGSDITEKLEPYELEY